MGFRENIAKATGIDRDMLPGSYQGIGHVMLLKFLPKKTKDNGKTRIQKLSEAQKKKIAEAVLGLYKQFHVVCEIAGIEGEYREPDVCVLKAEDGYSTETIHKEHGLQYMLDASKIMFSKGNLSERKRLVPDISKNEVIVDMFAGIGYFALGLSRNASKVYAIEKNRNAFYYLCENIELNKLEDKIEAIAGDCRIVADRLAGTADRVLMGFFSGTKGMGTELYLPAALKILKNKGMIHYHDIADFSKGEEKAWETILKKVKETLAENKYSIVNAKKHKVKSYAPRIWHVVLDMEVRKK